MVSEKVRDGLWEGQRWSLRRSEMVSEKVRDGLWRHQRLSLMSSEMVFDAVVICCSVSQRAISASEEPSLLVLFRAPKLFERSSKISLGWRCKWSARRMQSWARSSYAEPQPSLAMHPNALQRYALFPTPPNFVPHGVQKSVKKIPISH